MTTSFVPLSVQVVSTVILLACFVILLPTISTTAVDKRHLVAPIQPYETTEQHARQLVKGKGTLRIAVFGSSNAWGAMLESRFDAFPYLLSPEVVNYADFSAGPNYVATCVNSIIGNDSFDVFILDYWLKAPEGLDELASRLRERFPQAIMVFSKLWSPNTARRQPFQGSSDEMNIYEWKTSLGIQKGDYESTKRALLADDGYWYFPNYVNADTTFDETVESVGGVKFEFPKKPTAKETIIDYLGYFDETYHNHVSSLGHEVIARIMKEIIQIQYRIVPNLGVTDNVVGTWGAGDSCHLWYTTGGCKFDHSPNWEMIEFDKDRGKYALHVDDEGWIDVKNEFDNDRTLYLSFLSTDENWYPMTNVSFEGANGFISMELNPATGQDKRHAHITKTIPVGKIPPGTTRIVLKPLEQAFLPFRLLGASLTNEVAVPLTYGFGPSFNG